ncbi:MAG: CDP-diacylglycerol--serine O-phosphatidyltransferase, partial [Candidatus Riflebacteria bacterium]|nr:CDP-diacylglycerol--serine O-phosphatidyltransferase [Candidatus Riflebacteria bacterium]
MTEETVKARPETAVKDKRRFVSRHLSILPNACTSMNLFCGYASVVMTSQGEFLLAGWLIMLANIFDILDGRLARLTSVESRFGAELDSLSDLVSFGVAPAFLVYNRYLGQDIVYGLIITCIFVLCGALRLARFNVTP